MDDLQTLSISTRWTLMAIFAACVWVTQAQHLYICKLRKELDSRPTDEQIKQFIDDTIEKTFNESILDAPLPEGLWEARQ